MTRRRILIVEDEFLIAENCASLVEEVGFEVAGPYSKLGDVPQLSISTCVRFGLPAVTGAASVRDHVVS